MLSANVGTFSFSSAMGICLVPGQALSHISDGHIAMNPTGTRVFVCAEIFPSDIETYVLSTPFDLTSAGPPILFEPDSLPNGILFGNLRGIDFNATGTRAFMTFNGISNRTFGHIDMLTPYDFSTATDTIPFIDTDVIGGIITTQPSEGRISPTGDRFYYIESNTSRLRTFAVPTPFDISTLTEIPAEEIDLNTIIGSGALASFWLSDDGITLYVYMQITTVAAVSADTVWKLTLSTPFDMSTAVLDTNETIITLAPTDTPVSIILDPSLEHLYVTGDVGDTITRYNTVGNCTLPPTIPTFGCEDTITYSGNEHIITGEFTAGQGAGALFCRADGTQLFIADGGNSPTIRRISQLDLVSPNNITLPSVTTWITGIPLGGTTTRIEGVNLSTNGENMYLTIRREGGPSGQILWYTLPTPHQLSPAPVLAGTFNVTQTPDRKPRYGHITDDGSSFYYMHLTAGERFLVKMDLGTDYDITTAVDVAEVNLSSGLTPAHFTPGTAVAFTLDSTETHLYLYLSDGAQDSIEQAILNTPGDITTITPISPTTAFNAIQESIPRGIAMNDTREFFYLLGDQQRIFQYTTTQTVSCP